MNLRPTWIDFLGNILGGHTLYELGEKLDNRIQEGAVVYPPSDKIFRALSFFNPHETKVVIIGQDPYHGEGQADGLAFSVAKGTKMPPSLNNICAELYDDLGVERKNPDLSAWAKQGVLLLNTVLTVERGRPGSHNGYGWEIFTDTIIAKLAQVKPLVFVLWGKKAQSKLPLIGRSGIREHRVIGSPHPSPLSAGNGFFGSKPFSQINDFLYQMGEEPIDWGKE